MTVFDEAIMFAVKVHEGMIRKASGAPYILHPLEVASIAGTITSDPEVLAAAVLHDTVEDTETMLDEIRERFGGRVASLVASETEDKRRDVPPDESWIIRKKESLEALKKEKDPGARIIWLADKLSNIRSLALLKEKEGGAMWLRFNQRDPAKQEWYFRAVIENTKELSDTAAWRELVELTEKVFEGADNNG